MSVQQLRGEEGPSSPPRHAAPPGASSRVWMILTGASLLLRVVLACGTDVYFDEAYYWVWSRHLAFGYFDHPPLIAWLIAALGIRAAAFACGVAALGAIWLLAREVLADAPRAWAATAIASWTPGLFLSGVIGTPDAPLVVAWALWLWAMSRGRPVQAGVAGGLALLAKYSAAVAAPVTVAWALLERRLPRWSWAGAAIAIAVFAPCIGWNATHDWVSFRFQLHHGLGGEGGWTSLAEYLGGQLLMGGPVLLTLALAWGLRGARSQRLLRIACLLPLGVFALASLRTRGEANWPVAAYVSAAVGVAAMSTRWRWAALLPNLALCLGGVLHLTTGALALERDVPLERLQGWSTLRQLRADPSGVALAPSYQLASEVARYAGLRTDVVGGRASQYDLWPRVDVAVGEDALWIGEGGEVPAPLAAAFSSVEGPRILEGRAFGRVVHRFEVWTLRSRKPGAELRSPAF